MSMNCQIKILDGWNLNSYHPFRRPIELQPKILAFQVYFEHIQVCFHAFFLTPKGDKKEGRKSSRRNGNLNDVDGGN